MFKKTAIGVYLLIVVLLFFTHPFDGNGDFYHHINTGKYIAAHHALPYVDTLTFTRTGKPWIAYAWGTGLMLYGIFTLAGPWGVTVWVSGVAFITLYLLYKLLKTYSLAGPLALLLITLSVAPIAIRFPARPEIVAYPLLLSLLCIERFRQKRPKLVWAIPPIILLWANLYGSSVFVGLGLIALFAVRQFWIERNITKKTLPLYIATLISFPLSLVNGYGFRTLFYIFLIPKVASYEGEWAGITTILTSTPPSYLLATQYLILLYVLFAAAFAVVLAVCYKKIFAHPLLLLISASVIVPVFAFRHTPIAALLSLPLMAVLLREARPTGQKILTGILIIITVVSLGILLWVKPAGLSAGYDASGALHAFISAHNLSGRAFNYQAVGGWISYYFYPRITVFYDTRDDLFLNSPVFTDLFNTVTTGSSVMPLLAKYHANLIIADIFTDSINYRDVFYSPDWQIVYFNDRYFVAVRTGGKKRADLPNLYFIDPFAVSAAKAGLETDAEPYYRNLVRTAPESDNNKMYLAAVLIAENNYAETIQIINTIHVAPGPLQPLYSKNIHYSLGLAYLFTHDCAIAKTYFDLTARDVQGSFLFSPQEKLPTNLNQGLAYNALACGNDPKKAATYLHLFLSQPEVTPLEKIKTQQKYDSLQ